MFLAFFTVVGRYVRGGWLSGLIPILERLDSFLRQHDVFRVVLIVVLGRSLDGTPRYLIRILYI